LAADHFGSLRKTQEKAVGDFPVAIANRGISVVQAILVSSLVPACRSIGPHRRDEGNPLNVDGRS
jgi:hypothetical protein